MNIAQIYSYSSHSFWLVNVDINAVPLTSLVWGLAHITYQP